MIRNTPFEEWERQQMEDPGFRKAAEELEPAFQVALLRMKRGLTQKQLAKLVGTKQSSIARLESGRRQPSLSFLRRVARALKATLVVQLVPEDKTTVIIEETPRVSDSSDAQPEERSIPVYNWPGQERYPVPDDRTEHTLASSQSER